MKDLRIMSKGIAALALCLGMGACSSDDEGGTMEPERAGATVRIDSISRGGGSMAMATYKFNYDRQGRVTNYQVGKSHILTFDYQADQIVAMWEASSELSDAPHAIAEFHLVDGKIASAIMKDGPYSRDSIVYTYQDNRLAQCSAYQEWEKDGMELLYQQTMHWQNGNLTGMTATDQDGITVYETTMTYDETHPMKALLPNMSFDYLVKVGQSYVGRDFTNVLANMGYFGVLSRNVMTGIEIVNPGNVLSRRWLSQITYNYDAADNATGFDIHYERFDGISSQIENSSGFRVAWLAE